MNRDRISELEFVDGYIWANIEKVDAMVKIDPHSGYIKERIDFQPLKMAAVAY